MAGESTFSRQPSSARLKKLSCEGGGSGPNRDHRWSVIRRACRVRGLGWFCRCRQCRQPRSWLVGGAGLCPDPTVVRCALSGERDPEQTRRRAARCRAGESGLPAPSCLADAAFRRYPDRDLFIDLIDGRMKVAQREARREITDDQVNAELQAMNACFQATLRSGKRRGRP